MNHVDVDAGSRAAELIDDREVAGTDQDQLGHAQVAAQLEGLVRSVKTPTNIALYGPWGSGKSGIANLLKERLEASSGRGGQKIKFARFDAFKFAEKPLYRDFISAVSKELGVDKPRYRQDLYTGRTETNYKIPPGKATRLVVTFGLILLGVSLILVGLAALLAVAQSGPWKDDFTANGKSFVVAGFPFAAVLTALVALAGKQLGVETRTEKADSDEQFEGLFRDLVADSRADRVVVFVDEIDRCEPKDVVATLDAIRTFLGVPRCVFVVATDQQVLEQALNRDVRQATPLDAVNPYYSAGSAYLDKVFQYQVSVPPLLSQSVTGFAAALVRGRPGVWQALDRDNVVSVLIPSHVRSPRRVKHLLNAFVLAYRLAESRQAAGLLNTDVAARADELARLVCLQVEFPLFARDLVTDPRLPEYVHRLAEDRADGEGDDAAAVWEDFPYATDTARGLAERYARLDAAVDQVLVDPGDAPAQRVQQVRANHGQQLLDYLSKTRHINGPGRDLIHLQSSGTAVGLDGLLAERIENSAQDGQVQQVRRTVAGLADADKGNVVTLLVTQLRSAFGVEERNVAATLLALLSDSSLDLSGRSDFVLSALTRALSRNDDLLDASTLDGAWRLACLSDRDAARDLRERIVRSPLLAQDRTRAARVLGDAAKAAEADAHAVSELLAHHLLAADGMELVDDLRVLDPDQSLALLTAATTLPAALRKILKDEDAVKAAEEAERDAPAAPATAPGRPAAAPRPAADDDQADPREDPNNRAALGAPSRTAFAAWAGHLAALDDKRPLQALLAILLAADHEKARNLVAEHVAASGTWADRESTERLLAQFVVRRSTEWPDWLAAVDADAVDAETLATALGKAARLLWPRSQQKADGVAAAAAAVMTIVERLDPPVRRTVQDEALRHLGEPATSSGRAAQRTAALRAADPLLDSGLLASEHLAATETTALQATLTADLADADEETRDAMTAYVKAALDRVLAPAPAPAATSVIAALDGAAWIPEPDRIALRLAARRLDQDDRVPLAEVFAVLDEHPASTTPLLIAWLDVSDGASPSDLSATLDRARQVHEWENPRLLDAFARSRARLLPDAQQSLVHDWVHDHQRALPLDVARAVGLYDLATPDALDLLVDRYKACTNNDQRRKVLDLLGPLDTDRPRDRRRIVNDFLLPQFANGGAEATGYGLDALRALGKPIPRDVRGTMRDAVVAATEGRAGLESKGIQVLEAVGYPASDKGWVFKRRTINPVVDQEPEDETQ